MNVRQISLFEPYATVAVTCTENRSKNITGDQSPLVVMRYSRLDVVVLLDLSTFTAVRIKKEPLRLSVGKTKF